MSIPILIMISIIWVAILHYKKERVSNIEESQSKAFWNREHEANEVRKKDISNLPYITIPLDSLPFHENADEDLLEIYKIIRSLGDKKIVNLNHMSNTDLKLEYGVANLDILSEYDNNYVTLVRTLAKWGSYLYEHDEITDCRKVLEFGIQCNTDIKSNYILLAQLYKASGENGKVSHLISKAEQLDSLTKNSIIASLEKICEE